jgi:hypothetical protein
MWVRVRESERNRRERQREIEIDREREIEGEIPAHTTALRVNSWGVVGSKSLMRLYASFTSPFFK